MFFVWVAFGVVGGKRKILTSMTAAGIWKWRWRRQNKLYNMLIVKEDRRLAEAGAGGHV